VVLSLDGRAYGGDTAVGPAVRGALARTVGTRQRTASRGAPGPRGRAHLGKGRLGRRASSGTWGADAEVRPAPAGDAQRTRARDVAARWRSARFQFAGALFELIFLQIFV
jgi:hypothetical protein